VVDPVCKPFRGVFEGRIYRPVTILCRIFVMPGQESFGSHLTFILTCGKYKLPTALHFVSRSTALQEITTLIQQTVSHVPPFTKFGDNQKKFLPRFFFFQFEGDKF